MAADDTDIAVPFEELAPPIVLQDQDVPTVPDVEPNQPRLGQDADATLSSVLIRTFAAAVTTVVVESLSSSVASTISAQLSASTELASSSSIVEPSLIATPAAAGHGGYFGAFLGVLRIFWLPFSYTLTLQFNVMASIVLIVLGGYLFIRYRFLTKYSRLPIPPRANETSASFDLHPDATGDPNESRNLGYPDEFWSAFLSSIKVFGYLDRPVFHELARHLETRKLKAGEILFDAGDDDRNFYVVVDGLVQVFVKNREEIDDAASSTQQSTPNANYNETDAEDEGFPEKKSWAGHTLLNEVKAGGTVSSLFSILSVFTEDLELPTAPFSVGIRGNETDTETIASGVQNAKSEVEGSPQPAYQFPATAPTISEKAFPGLARSPSNESESSINRPILQIQTSGSEHVSWAKNPTAPVQRPSSASPMLFHPNVVARAHTNTTLAVIPAAAFHKLTEKFPNAAAHITQVILTRFQRVTFLTLHRYLGLSRELLKIEKRVNEFSGFGLPEDLFPPGLLDRLRVYHRMHHDNHYDSDAAALTDVPGARGARAKSPPRSPTSTAKREPRGPTRMRRQPSGRESMRAAARAFHEDMYEGDLDDSERESVVVDGVTPFTSLRASAAPRPTTIFSGLSGSSPGYFDGVPGMMPDDLRILKETVFDCIANIIGMIPAADSVDGARGSPLMRKNKGAVAGVSAGAIADLLLLRKRSFDRRSTSSMDNWSASGQNSSTAFGETGSVRSASVGRSGASTPTTPSTPPHNDTGSDILIHFYNRGSVVVREGERNSGLYFVIDGILEVSMEQKNAGLIGLVGQDASKTAAGYSKKPRKSLFLIKPGGLAGYLSALTDHPSSVHIQAKTDAIVGFMPKAVLDRYIERYPNILLCLGKRFIMQLSPLIFHIDISLEWGQVNAGQVLCRQSDPAEAIYIVLNGRLRSIQETVAAPTQSAPVPVTNGKGKTFETEAPAGATPRLEILGEHGQGESVGEVEVLMDLPRFGTVHAIRDTEIAIMPKTLFNALAVQNPEVTIQISRIIAQRSRSTISQLRSSPSSGFGPGVGGKANVNLKTVAILPVTSAVPVSEFSERLRGALELIGESVAMLNTTQVMDKLGKHAFSRLGRLKLMSWLAEQEESHRLVLYVADGGVNAPWTQRCVRQADCILLVGLGDGEPNIGEFERLLLGMKTTARKELVLLHSERFCVSGRTAEWLKNRLWVHAHHHVHMPSTAQKMISRSLAQRRVAPLQQIANRIQNLQFQFFNEIDNIADAFMGTRGRRGTELFDFDDGTGHEHEETVEVNHTALRTDFARLARRLLSRSVALVLGGGGARGISHVGIIRAFEEAGIPIDMVGGTSIGAFVGGLYAWEDNYVSMRGRAKRFSARQASMWRNVLDLTYPVTSLLTGHEFNRGIWKCFRDTQIEDCWLPYFCVTTNITWSRMQVHTFGYIWRYVRASMSLAGYIPPLCEQGDMLLDGGYINNLPADIMRGQFGADTVITVDVGNVDDTSPIDYGDSLSGWWVILNRWFNPFPSAAKRVPQIAEIQSRLAYVSSVKQLEEAKNLEGVLYIHPPVSKFGILEFGSHEEIEKVGYEFGKDMVKKWRKEGILESKFGIPRKDTRGRGVRRASI
ncbi:hypothetical protein BJ742DRAFT_832941 [Cladochytrium replicatum]|nr:hypothetical protein BJ742DRAFT_832941 [Cladochytrium replicatum]